MFDVVSVRKEKYSPASHRCEPAIRTTMRLVPLTMGIHRTGRLAHAPSFSFSASLEYSMCAKFRLRFQDLDLSGGREPLLPELRNRYILEHILINQLKGLKGSRRHADSIIASAGNFGRSSRILDKLGVQLPATG